MVRARTNAASKPATKGKGKGRQRKSKVVAPDLSGEDRKVVHPKPRVELLTDKNALTADKAKELLGWREEADKVNFGRDYLLVTPEGKKVRCENNVTNRPLYKAVYTTLMQEILRGRWQLNMENRIIGCTGLILNGQHTLIGLVLADMEWQQNKDKYPFWDTRPTIETAIGYGIPEEDAVVNTMDTCKPRSLADVIYRSAYFADKTSKERKVAARATDYAVRLLWHRTGASMDAFGLRRTHAESLAFIERHPKLLECVSHIITEDGDKHNVGRYLSSGYASALLYLMACCKADPTEYSEAQDPTESMLTFDNWDKACDFWVLLAQRADEVKAVSTVLANIIEEDGGSNMERQALIVKAWNLYVGGKPITPKRIALNYDTDEDGFKTLDDLPCVGGIDLGEPYLTDEEDIKATDPTEEQIAERKQKEKAQPKLKPRKAGKFWAKGDIAWVLEEDGESFIGELVEDPYDCDDDLRRVTVHSATGDWEVQVSQLSLSRPSAKAPKKASRSSKGWKPTVGKVAWVCSDGEEPWKGKVTELLGTNARLKVLQGFQGAGNEVAAKVADLHQKQPN